MEPIQYEQRGYLKENFRLFHLADNEHSPISYHYHTFHKVVILIAGRAGYCIEGEQFDISPNDCILVARGSVHRPNVVSGDFYERMILYIDPQYLKRISRLDQLATCFLKAQADQRYVLKATPRVRELFLQLEKSKLDNGFGNDLLSESVFIQLIVELNRLYMDGEEVEATSKDSKIVTVLQYLNEHITDTVSIDELSERFYISKYHLMRKFKEKTGYSIHQYIQEKRLLIAQEMLQKGIPYMHVAEQCGYQDYSTFSRAYKNHFGQAPRETMRGK